MTRLSQRLISVLLALFMLAYVSYQAWRYFSKPYTTEVAFSYSISNTLEGNGIAVRSEALLEGGGSGVESRVYDDATWVSVGQPVVEYYSSAVGDGRMSRLRELEEEIAMLREAQDETVVNYSNTDNLDRDIRERIGRLTGMSGTGRYGALSGVRTELVSLINKRQFVTGKEDGFEGRIAVLQAEYEQIRTAAGTESLSDVKAPVSGYYVGKADGYEQLGFDCLAYTVDELLALVESRPVSGIGGVGKIVTSPDWYFLAAVPKFEAQSLYGGQSVDLFFPEISGATPAAVRDVLQSREEDNAVVVLHSNYVSPQLVNLRASNVEIRYEQSSGLRVSSEAIRFQGDQRGVYIVSEGTVYFKKINPVYEGQGYILSKEDADPQSNEFVSLYDQIIVKGIDLYDGKLIR